MEIMEFSKLKSISGPLLVTGHTGFKGTWLTLLLESMGIETVGYSLPPQEKSLFNTLSRASKIHEKFGDIRDFESLNEFITSCRPVAVLHMAAQPLVLESYTSPRDTFRTNVLGTVNVLDASIKSSSIQSIGVVTTDKVYKNLNLGKRFIESDPLGGKDPYSASKVGTEAAVAAWQQISRVTGGPSIFSLRAGNVIGGGDLAENRLIPDLVRHFETGNKLEIRSPRATRPWQHVLDPLQGYLMALEASLNKLDISSLNFAPVEESLSVDEVVGIAQETWGRPGNIIFSRDENSLESEKLDLDPSKAMKLLGWKPAWNQIEAVQDSIKWWKKMLSEKTDPLELCQTDLNQLHRNYIK
jgi:CDP-glucose 4,6-dehydratase